MAFGGRRWVIYPDAWRMCQTVQAWCMGREVAPELLSPHIWLSGQLGEQALNAGRIKPIADRRTIGAAARTNNTRPPNPDCPAGKRPRGRRIRIAALEIGSTRRVWIRGPPPLAHAMPTYAVEIRKGARSSAAPDPPREYFPNPDDCAPAQSIYIAYPSCYRVAFIRAALFGGVKSGGPISRVARFFSYKRGDIRRPFLSVVTATGAYSLRLRALYAGLMGTQRYRTKTTFSGRLGWIWGYFFVRPPARFSSPIPQGVAPPRGRLLPAT